MKQLIVGLVLVVAVYLGATYWLGSLAEAQYRAAVAEASAAQGVNVVSLQYARGLFVSRAATRVEIDLDGAGSRRADAELAFTTRDEIFHGPLPLIALTRSDVPLRPGIALVRQTLDPASGDWARGLAQSADGDAPIHAVTQIGFDGGSLTQVSAAVLSMENIEIAREEAPWDLRAMGLDAALRRSPSDPDVRLDLELRGLNVSPARSGETTADSGARLRLRDLSVAIDQQAEGTGLVLGSLRAALGSMQVATGDEPSQGLQLDELAVDVTTRLSAESADQVELEQGLSVGQAAIRGETGSGRLRWTLHRLDRDALLQLQRLAADRAQAALGADALGDELLRLGRQMLQREPELRLDVAVALAQGDLDGRLRLSVQDLARAADFQNPSMLIGLLKNAALDLSVASSLAQHLAEKTRSTEDYEATLEAARSKGLIGSDAGRLTTAARFDRGRLTVNERAIPLPFAYPPPRDAEQTTDP